MKIDGKVLINTLHEKIKIQPEILNQLTQNEVDALDIKIQEFVNNNKEGSIEVSDLVYYKIINPKDCQIQENLHYVKLVKSIEKLNNEIFKDNLKPLPKLSENLVEDRKLFLSDISVNEMKKYGFTPLHVASINGDIQAVISLIKDGANPNKKDKNGNTPVHYAATKGHIQVIQKLIELGANVNILNNEGATALDLVKQKGSEKYKEISAFFKLNFPDLSVQSKEYIRRKSIGHAWHLKGTSSLQRTGKKSDSSAIDLEAALDTAWFNQIRKDFLNFEEQYANPLSEKHSKLINNTLNFAAEYFGEKDDLSIKATLDRIQEGLPTFISSGWSEHAVTFLIYGDQLVICNRGAVSDVPMEVFHFENKITLELITKLQNFQDEVSYKKYCLEYKGLAKELGFFKEQLDVQLEKASPLPKQIVGNCSWVSPNTGIRALLMIMAVRDVPQENQEKLYKLLEEAKECDNLRLASHQISILKRGLKSLDTKKSPIKIDHVLIQNAMHKAYLLPLDEILSEELSLITEKYQNSLDGIDLINFKKSLQFWKIQGRGSFTDLGNAHLINIKPENNKNLLSKKWSKVFKDVSYV